MRKIIFILIAVFLAFIVEFFVFNLMTTRWVPNLMVVLIVFVNLAFGIRYSIFTAVFAGILKDAFGLQVFGVNLLVYVVCAYLITVIKPYIYQAGSNISRVLLVVAILTVDFVIRFFISIKIGTADFVPAFRFIFIPQMLVTILITVELFKHLRQCVLKYFV